MKTAYLSAFFKALETLHIFRNALVDWKYILAIGLYLSHHSLFSFFKSDTFQGVQIIKSYSSGGIGFWKYSLFFPSCRDNWENTKHIYLFTEKYLTLLWDLQLTTRNFNWKSPWEATRKVNITGKCEQKVFQLQAFKNHFRNIIYFPLQVGMFWKC